MKENYETPLMETFEMDAVDMVRTSEPKNPSDTPDNSAGGGTGL